MEEQSHQNALLLISSEFGGNTNCVSNFAEGDVNQPYFMAAEMSGIHHAPRLLPQWSQFQQPAINYVEFLAENGLPEIQREMPYNSSGMVSSFKPSDTCLDLDEKKGRYLRRPHGGEGAPMNIFTNGEHSTHVQRQESVEEYCNISRSHLSIAAAPAFPPKLRSNAARRRAPSSDHHRRFRIAERLAALQDFLPQPRQGGKAALLDDIIDHIKYLQLQIKDLSRNRLGAESTSHPFVFLEGYGHYLLHDQMQNEPLEALMGKLLEVNPSAALQLLESRGIFMMPMALAEGLHQTI